MKEGKYEDETSLQHLFSLQLTSLSCSCPSSLFVFLLYPPRTFFSLHPCCLLWGQYFLLTCLSFSLSLVMSLRESCLASLTPRKGWKRHVMTREMRRGREKRTFLVTQVMKLWEKKKGLNAWFGLQLVSLSVVIQLWSLFEEGEKGWRQAMMKRKSKEWRRKSLKMREDDDERGLWVKEGMLKGCIEEVKPLLFFLSSSVEMKWRDCNFLCPASSLFLLFCSNELYYPFLFSLIFRLLLLVFPFDDLLLLDVSFLLQLFTSITKRLTNQMLDTHSSPFSLFDRRFVFDPSCSFPLKVLCETTFLQQPSFIVTLLCWAGWAACIPLTRPLLMTWPVFNLNPEINHLKRPGKEVCGQWNRLLSIEIRHKSLLIFGTSSLFWDCNWTSVHLFHHEISSIITNGSLIISYSQSCWAKKKRKRGMKSFLSHRKKGYCFWLELFIRCVTSIPSIGLHPRTLFWLFFVFFSDI